MDDFDRMKAGLEAWYHEGDASGLEPFLGWLHKVTSGMAARARLGKADGEDFESYVTEHFVDRVAHVGLGAESVAYWRNRVSQRLIDFVRRGRTHAGRYVPLEDNVDPPAPPAADPERSAAVRQRCRRAAAALQEMPPRERLVLLLHKGLGAFLRPDDVELLAKWTGRPPDELRTSLPRGAPRHSEELLPLLFAADAFADAEGRDRCLDTLRKARGRAERRLARLAEGDA
jgi:DNA-directed RNA polymerase specialized sigma24 family protein